MEAMATPLMLQVVILLMAVQICVEEKIVIASATPTQIDAVFTKIAINDDDVENAPKLQIHRR
jgi:hypothetical protein